MARPSNNEILARYRKKITQSKRWRREEYYDDTWRRLVDLYQGKHYEHYAEEDRILVNLAFSTVNVIAPSISVNYPKITVNAVNPDNAGQAVIAEAVVNYWWRHRNFKDHFRSAVKDFLIVGHGWLKVGYRYVEEERVGDFEDVSDANVEENVTSTTLVVTKDEPFVERVSPFDVFVDPDATSMDDAKWICHRVRRTLNDVRTDKRYAKNAREDVPAVSYARYTDDPSSRKIHDKDEGYADVYEFYDLKNNTVSVFADGGESFLIKPKKQPYAFGHPFVMLRNYDIPDCFYPMGDLEAIEPMQRELNETRTQMMNHRKRYARKYLYRETNFDSNGRAALESDEDNVMVPVQGDMPLADAVAPFPALINPPEFYNQSELIRTDIELISGVTEFMRGGVSEIRRTATEAALIQDAQNARTADKLAVIETCIAKLGRRVLQLAQQFMTGEQVARITARDGEPMWVTFDRDYIDGEFDFEVAAGSTQPTNEAYRRQSALQMVDAMAPFVSAGVIDVAKLGAYVLQFGFGVKNPEMFMTTPEQPQPDEMAMGAPPMPAPPVDAMGAMGAMGAGAPPIDPMMLAALAAGQPPEGAPMPPMI
jgi:hypothetical protein